MSISCPFILLVMLCLVGCDKSRELPIAERSDISIAFSGISEGQALEGTLYSVLQISAVVQSTRPLSEVRYFLVKDGVPTDYGTPITQFADPLHFEISLQVNLDAMYTGFKVLARDAHGDTSSHTVRLSVLESSFYVHFLGEAADTLRVSVFKPEVRFQVKSDKGLSSVEIFWVNPQGVAQPLGATRTTFADSHLYEGVINASDIVFSDNIRYIQVRGRDVTGRFVVGRVAIVMVQEPLITFADAPGPLRVNTNPLTPKPDIRYSVSSAGLDSIQVYLSYVGGSRLLHWHASGSSLNVSLYQGVVSSIPYVDSLSGVCVVVRAKGESSYTTLCLDLDVFTDNNLAPMVTFLGNSPLLLNQNVSSVLPLVRWHIQSASGLSEIRYYVVSSTDGEVLVSTHPVQNSSDKMFGEFPLLRSQLQGLQALKVVGVDAAGRVGECVLPVSLYSQTPVSEAIAFPGADGYGKSTTGGRGGRVLYVTKLVDDNSEGTLRWAVGQSGARIVMFKVAGIIALNSVLEIKNPDITIAGQTTPGGGICIKNYGVMVKTSNVIIRYLFFRMGDEKQYQGDALEGDKQSNIIIDHCSMSWSTDECSSFYDNKNFTMQWCILAESLRVSIHGKGTHGYGGIWGGQQVSFHHNLLAHHDSRNPRFCGSRYSKQPELEQVDFRNNVIYNWGDNSAYAGEGGQYNMVNNYYRAGAATKSGIRNRIFQPNAQDPNEPTQQAAGTWGKFWLAGNVVHDQDPTTADNWLGFQPSTGNGGYPGGNIANIKLTQAFAVPKQAVTHTAQDAYDKVTAYAGASLSRDVVDARIANEVRTGTTTFTGSRGGTKGLIDTQGDVGGWPVYQSVANPVDTDNDGMPDAWELTNGLDKNNAADGKSNTFNTNYTNVEMYINSLVDHITKEQQ